MPKLLLIIHNGDQNNIISGLKVFSLKVFIFLCDGTWSSHDALEFQLVIQSFPFHGVLFLGPLVIYHHFINAISHLSLLGGPSVD